MAFFILSSLPCSFTKMFLPLEKKNSYQAIGNSNSNCVNRCKASYKVAKDHSQIVTRRSSNFQPSIWTYDHIQSLSSEYKVRFNTYVVSSLHIYLRVKYIFSSSKKILCRQFYFMLLSRLMICFNIGIKNV